MNKKRFVLAALLLLLVVLLTLGITTACMRSQSTTDADDDTDTDTDSDTDTDTDTDTDEFDDDFEDEKKDEYPVFEETVGDVRLQIYSENVLRLELKGESGFVDEKTLCVDDRSSWNGANVTRAETDDSVSFTTSTFVLTLPKNAKAISEASLTDKEGESLWTYKATASSFGNLPSPAATPKTWSFNDSPRIVPGDNAFEVPASVSAAEKYNGWKYEEDAQDYYIFVTEGDAFRLREDFVHLTGSCDIVPLKALGLWFSRYHAYTDEEFLGVIDKFREEGYPIDMLVVDTDWRSSNDGTGYRVSSRYFPDLEGFFDATDAKNVNVVMNDHVHSSSASILSYSQLKWFGEGLKKNLDAGLSAWWYDRNWFYTLNSPFPDIHGDMLGQNMYLWFMRDRKADIGDTTRTYMLSNIYYLYNGGFTTTPPHVSLHKYSIQWTGDISSTSSSLKNEIENLVRVGVNTSLGYYSSDITGHTGDPLPALFIRWTQYGALSPIMRYHSNEKYTREPWLKGDYTNDIAKEYINMRYRLMPVFYTSSYENYALGLPIARRLDFYYPDLRKASDNTQYLLGDSILVAPFYSSDSSDGLASSYFTAADGSNGLDAEYFNNATLEGEPALKRKDANIEFNWGTGSPTSAVGSDNFSVRWTGKLTVGEEPIRLAITSDDGARVYIDGELVINNWNASDSLTVYAAKSLEANKSYDIKVEYFELTGGALITLFNTDANLENVTDKRSVYIPNGRWTNVFTGEVEVGPKNASITMPLSQSPIFVREGSLNILAPFGDHTETSDWKEIVLDVYPALDSSDKTTLYEDDGETEAYKNGDYRLTTFVTNFDADGKMTLKAKPYSPNGYTGDFTERKVTLRIHTDEAVSISVNGNSVSAERIEKDSSAYPFAIEGGSPDGTVYTASFVVPAGSPFTVTAE